MNDPIILKEESFQKAWAKAALIINETGNNVYDLVVRINNPNLFNEDIHQMMENFVKKHSNKLISYNKVANTIFPYKYYFSKCDKNHLYNRYKRFYRISRSMPNSSWGTYFYQMINYGSSEEPVNQLEIVIDKIKKCARNHGCSHFIVIPDPKKHAGRTMGGPCLNYITIQTENCNLRGCRYKIHMLAIYRNHYFTERSYGNYLGLCWLLQFICKETNSEVGSITCISSHALIEEYKQEVVNLAKEINKR